MMNITFEWHISEAFMTKAHQTSSVLTLTVYICTRCMSKLFQANKHSPIGNSAFMCSIAPFLSANFTNRCFGSGQYNLPGRTSGVSLQTAKCSRMTTSGRLPTILQYVCLQLSIRHEQTQCCNQVDVMIFEMGCQELTLSRQKVLACS